MKKISSTFLMATAFAVATSFSLSGLAYAQSTTYVTPTFYNQSGQVLNMNGAALSAGYYYLQNGDQAYYYGNGTYYDQTAGVYGGQIFGSAGSSVTSSGATPVFYNQSGQVLNPTGTALSAGYYFLQNGTQVYYFGNGTYYNTVTQTYGGMIFGGAVASVGTPGVPNTGMGGLSYVNWTILISAGLIFFAAVAYTAKAALAPRRTATIS